MTNDDLAALRYARELLENPRLAARMTHLLGTPIEKALAMLPEGASALIAAATRKALEAAMNVALSSLGEQRPAQSANFLHKSLAGLSGAAGGALGLPALAVELPVSTTIILRSIADIARNEGEDIRSVEARLACLEVFALGGSSKADDGAETGYYAVRAVLAKTLKDAAEHVARNGLAQGSAPQLLRLISQIAARFGVPVTEKAVAQALPVVGAAGGALINTLFIDHFQAVSRGHFMVRRLERVYGAREVREAYAALAYHSGRVY